MKTTYDEYKKYKTELKEYVRCDEEFFDLLIHSPISSIEEILNREINICLKPYVLLSIHQLRSLLRKMNRFFNFFYKNLEFAINYDDIIIPMIRYFIFTGQDIKLINLFIEFHKRRRTIPLLLLAVYFTLTESEEYKTYMEFINQVYSKEITRYLNPDTIFLFHFKTKFDVLHQKVFFSQELIYVYNQWSRKLTDYQKILLSNWFLINFISMGNLYTAFQFLRWLKKTQKFPLLKEFYQSWELKIGLILMKNHKFSALKYIKNHSLLYSNQKEFFTKFNFLFLRKHNPNINMNKLFFEFHFFDFYQVLHLFFEKLMLIGITSFSLDVEEIWKSLETTFIQLPSYEQNGFYSLIKLHTKQKENSIDLILLIFYKHRKKILLYAGFDPYCKALIGLLYEKYQPSLSFQLYKGNPHPLVIFRMERLYKVFPLSDSIIKAGYIKKKLEKIKKKFILTNK